MFKTIRTKMIWMQIIMMAIIIGTIFVFFSIFTDDYYFDRKIKLIENAYHKLETKDLSSLKFGDLDLVRYRDQNLKFVITDENFQSVFASPNSEISETTKAKIKKYIVKKKDNYKSELITKNKKHRICGYGAITQNGHKFYVYIYETKLKMRIGFSYYKKFLVLIGFVAVAAGVIVSIIISNKISKPIRQIESSASKAVANGFDIEIEENQNFSELSGLASSINKMMHQIRQQMKELEEELEHKTAVEEQRRTFVNNVSHEMKTPLAIISSQVEMLELIHDEGQRKEYYKSIIDETRHMSDMINDMLIKYTAENEEETVVRECVNISDLVGQVCTKCRDLFSRNKITLHLENKQECFAMANERFLMQAVDNYITNAVKHSNDNGKVYVRVKNIKDYVRIEVENQGPPIPDEYKDKIWDMFYSGDSGQTLSGQKGSGLGLSIVKKIVMLHNGNYGFENLDRGIVFWIEIPTI